MVMDHCALVHNLWSIDQPRKKLTIWTGILDAINHLPNKVVVEASLPHQGLSLHN